MRSGDEGRHVIRGDFPSTTSAIAASNLGAIIELLRTEGPLQKSEIGERTGLSPATVSRLVKHLTDRGFVAKTGVGASSGGRPPVMLGVVPEALVVAAVQAHADRIIGALVGLDGGVLVRRESRMAGTAVGDGPEALRDMIRDLIETARGQGLPLHAVGVSIAGVTDPAGPITGLDTRHWPTITVDDIRDGFEVPVVVENDANVLAIGELHRGVGREARHFVALVLDRGLGSGVVTNGALYRGARSSAGEVGYLLIGDDSLERDRFERGELEAMLEPATVTRAALGAGIDLDRQVTAPEIIALANDGDERALEVAADVLDGLARGVAAMASILDPGVIVLGEGLDLRADAVIPALRDRLEGRIQFVPDIRTATLGSDAVLLGAAEMALRAGAAPIPLEPELRSVR